MPRIREFTNTSDFEAQPLSVAARRQDVLGDEQSRNIERGFGAVREGIGQVEEHLAQNETSKLAADMATEHANSEVELNDLIKNSDGSDPNLATNFLAKAADRRAKLGENLLTQQAQNFFTQHNAQVGAQLAVKAHADQATLEGERELANIDTIKNQTTNKLREDPSLLSATLGPGGTLETQLNATRLNRLPVAQQEQIRRQAKEEGAIAAVEGAVAKNPQATKDALERGELNDYLDGPKVQSLISHADSQIRLGREADNQARIANDRAKKQAADESTNGYATQILTDPTKVDKKALANDPNLTYEQKFMLSGKLTQALKGEDDSDSPGAAKLGQGYWDARQKVLSGEITGAGDIYKLAGPHTGITLAGAKDLVELDKTVRNGEQKGDYAHESFNKFDSWFHKQVTEPHGFKRFGDDPETDYFKGHMIMQQRYEQGLRDKKTPNDLLNPESKDFIAKDLKDFQGGMNENTFVEPAKLNTIPSGAKGSPQGITALQAEVKAGRMNRSQAAAYAAKQGWLATAPTIATVPAATH